MKCIFFSTNYEIVSIRLLNGKVPEDTIRNMENILEHMKSIPVNEFDRVFEYDNQFHEQLVLMSKLRGLRGMERTVLQQSAGRIQFTGRKRKKYWNDSMIIILPSWRHARGGDCNKICQEVKKHYWTTIFPYAAGSET